MDPTIKSYMTRNESNKLKRYFCKNFTFLEYNQQILKKKESEDKEDEKE